MKTYAVSSSVFLTALLSLIVFNEIFNWNFYIGAIFSFIAIHFYIVEIRKSKKKIVEEEEGDVFVVDGTLSEGEYETGEIFVVDGTLSEEEYEEFFSNETV